ncbi:MAG: hypothetical protein H0V17_03225, partial [Deltaproteobacteria bacterium]|nr:hypothetical protein [Deltaproteobacteria bacterium]
MRHLLFVVAALAACGNDSAKGTGGGAPPPQTTPSTVASGSAVAQDPTPAPKPEAKPEDPKPADPTPAPPPKDPPIDGHDFTSAGKTLAVVGACMTGPTPEGYSEKPVVDHCKKVNTVQTEYADRWVKLAKPFFAERVPATASKKVVYPFSGGDLSTALTVYPDADEITTMSLEPAGDPRTLQALNDAATKPIGKATKPSPQAKQTLEKALGTVRYELDFLYRVNFSNTRNMMDAMRSGTLPTQLIFSLS